MDAQLHKAGLGILIASATLSMFWTPARAQDRILEQDPSLNNLVHGEGYAVSDSSGVGRVDCVGAGEQAVFLIPGLGFSGHVFDSLPREPEDRFTFCTVTLAGFGGTPALPMPPREVSYADQTWIRSAVHELAVFIHRNELEAPLIVGHMGLGTQVALRLAVDHPDVVRGVMLVAGEPARPVGGLGLEDMTPEARRLAVDASLAPNWFRTVTKATWDSNMWPASIYTADPETASSWWDEVALVPMPVMIRYLCEFLAHDGRQDLAMLKAPLWVLEPGFSEALRDNTFLPYAIQFHQAVWDEVQAPARMRRMRVEGAHLLIMQDRPDLAVEALHDFATAIDTDP
ncbi:MAG: hypothetical protein Rubg2KO_40210 [Rubricoccaceae bacterium]